MKRHLLIALLTTGLVSAQKEISDLEVKYMYSTAKDTTHAGEKMTEVMVLDFNSKASVYYSEAFLERRKAIETQLAIAKNSGQMADIDARKMVRPKIDYSVYKNNGKAWVTSRIGSNLYTFEGDSQKWKTDFADEKIIIGYPCKKATTTFNKRMYTAWYTKEVPISEGPYRFKGLPGLILEIEDASGYDYFTAVSIEKKKTEIVPLQKGIAVSRSEYVKKREEFKNDPYPGKPMDLNRHNQLESFKKKFNNTLER
ncbi:GLPGLI family protein [uncultured Chryseobacterium sp.]|uniref:GLPGLI family protein n=1 Tax=uncultured Chryseobacterium sp. TaxID=259322 RepID=UPI00260136D7|nr:GLPGLI family protein [uncultured Chryseobacterium sp.]